MQDQINELKSRIESLEKYLTQQGLNFEEAIRNAVFFDSDIGSASSTVVVTGVDFGAETVTTATIQTGVAAKFLKLYYRGQVYKIPVYSIT